MNWLRAVVIAAMIVGCIFVLVTFAFILSAM